jgi:hypothetical protein
VACCLPIKAISRATPAVRPAARAGIPWQAADPGPLACQKSPRCVLPAPSATPGGPSRPHCLRLHVTFDVKFLMWITSRRCGPSLGRELFLTHKRCIA